MMPIFDISQEVFSCAVFPGDPAPNKKVLCSMEAGSLYNLTALSMCAHNGTHVDAPFHFLRDGKAVDEMPLEHFVGECYVAYHEGDLSAADAWDVLSRAAGRKRILIAGPATVTNAAAQVFADADLLLIGNESQTVGPQDAPMAVHQLLLGKGIALLEGVVLKNIPEGPYFLSAAPLNLAGADGAPCRALLIRF